MTPDYVVFTRSALTGTANIETTTSDYAHAQTIARTIGGNIMYADHFHRAYKAVSSRRAVERYGKGES